MSTNSKSTGSKPKSKPKSRKKKNKSAKLQIFLVTLGITVALVGTFFWFVKLREFPVMTVKSEDKQYALTVTEYGEPDFPIGATHCKFSLTKDGKSVTEYKFDVNNEGLRANSDNFTVDWGKSGVKVTVSDRNETRTIYNINYNGKVKTETETIQQDDKDVTTG